MYGKKSPAKGKGKAEKMSGMSAMSGSKKSDMKGMDKMMMAKKAKKKI